MEMGAAPLALHPLALAVSLFMLFFYADSALVKQQQQLQQLVKLIDPAKTSQM